MDSTNDFKIEILEETIPMKENKDGTTKNPSLEDIVNQEPVLMDNTMSSGTDDKSAPFSKEQKVGEEKTSYQKTINK